MFTKKDYFTLSGDTGDIEILHDDFNLSELALLFPNVNSIMIPKKAEYNLKKNVSKILLKQIDPNVEVAIEKCLLVLSNLASTYYVEDKDNEENRWKRLNSKILHEQTKNKDNTYIYPQIIEVLKKGTANGPFIEVTEDNITNVQSRSYRITPSYYKAGLKEYFINDAGIIQNRNKVYYEQLNEALGNPICSNLIKVYPKLELPTSEELLIIGKQLVKNGYRTKKGKILTLRNRHKNDYWNDSNNRSFVEDNIKLFEYLTNRGFIIPSAGNEKSGGRVIDSFTLMPSWIRAQITIEGKKLTECDYSALHPNIAIKLYGGNQNYITHLAVSEATDIDLKEVKIEHLSFFNKNWHSMRKSLLFDYYSKNETTMLENIYKDKKSNGYKITSKKMFAVEVAIMTDVIKYLNTKNINVLYVYDALLCEEKDKSTVVDTMNRIILQHGVKTKVKTNEISTSTEKNGVVMFSPNYEVNLYNLLPTLSFSVNESMLIIQYFNRSKVLMKELLDYFKNQKKEQRYNDFGGVMITDEKINKLRGILKG
ncbi:MAG TPA: hypothetical protein PLL09_01325 [Flavobacterium sp.]|uniref:hypothetical protein n=2 Tax=Flavobacterium TaxID=237 RepID=UPI0025BC6B5E|nr:MULTISPECIES: hypothetical protein [unclassified Flavobacterium]HRE76442.1 hypothetical protein [Flavobacterium sp.]